MNLVSLHPGIWLSVECLVSLNIFLPMTAPIPKLNLEKLSQAFSWKGSLYTDAALLHDVGWEKKDWFLHKYLVSVQLNSVFFSSFLICKRDCSFALQIETDVLFFLTISIATACQSGWLWSASCLWSCWWASWETCWSWWLSARTDNSGGSELFFSFVLHIYILYILYIHTPKLPITHSVSVCKWH